MIGFLEHGLECDLRDINSLASSEPTALLVAGDEYSLQRVQERVLESCRELESSVTQVGFEKRASLTRGEGVVLTFPKLLEVSCGTMWHRENFVDFMLAYESQRRRHPCSKFTLLPFSLV